MVHSKDLKIAGKPVEEAKSVLIMVHGRGGSAEDILSLSPHLKVQDFALIAPQATNQSWYPKSFLAPPSQNEPGLSSALEVLAAIEEDLKKQGISAENLYFLGFSQGACLTLEYTCRNAKKYGGVVAFTGGLIGDKVYEENYSGSFEKTPVFIGTSDPDPHVPIERINETSHILQKLEAESVVKVYRDMGHTINQDEIRLANELVFSWEG